MNTAPPWAWPATNGPWICFIGSVTNTDVFTFGRHGGRRPDISPDRFLSFLITDTTGIRAVGIKLTLHLRHAGEDLHDFRPRRAQGGRLVMCGARAMTSAASPC